MAKRKRTPPKLTREYLMASGVRYLGRYSASRSRTRRILLKRVDASLEAHGGSRRSAVDLVESVLDRLEELGALDDSRYAERTVQIQRKRGKSARAIRSYLRQRGVDADVVDDALRPTSDPAAPSADLVAAATYARKRRLGPYRRTDRDELRRKDLAKLARRGFSFGVASQVIDAENVDALLELVDP